MTANGNYMQTSQPTWLDQLRGKLFPIKTCNTPEIPKTGDCVVTRTTVSLSWLGRLQMLISGRIAVETETITENVVGNCQTVSCSYVKAPQFMERKTR